jgi:hypothetical protein
MPPMLSSVRRRAAFGAEGLLDVAERLVEPTPASWSAAPRLADAQSASPKRGWRSLVSLRGRPGVPPGRPR